MKHGIYILLLLITGIVTTISCKKGDNNTPTPVQIDSLKAALPTQIIIKDTYDSGYLSTPPIFVTDTYVVSIKYDTTNRRIDLYEDDTTNTNPYDVLIGTYMYNSSGYLSSFTQVTDNFVEKIVVGFTATINRTPDNRITSIVSVYADGSGTDSTLYAYQAVTGGTSISTIFNEYDNTNTLTETDTSTYFYSADYRLTKALEYQGTYNYTYNANNSLQGFSLQGAGISVNGTYSYASGLADGKTDVFLQTLLGKDYYLYDLKAFDPFVISVDADFENIGNSITDPYHVTSGVEQINDTGAPINQSGTWVYELNSQNNISRVTTTGVEESFDFKLKY